MAGTAATAITLRDAGRIVFVVEDAAVVARSLALAILRTKLGDPLRVGLRHRRHRAQLVQQLREQVVRARRQLRTKLDVSFEHTSAVEGPTSHHHLDVAAA